MKIYIDLQKNAITKVITKDSAYEGDIFSNVFELMIYNYSNTNWFVTMSQLAPNHREAGDFTADALQENESNIVEENDITYLKFTFTMSDGWVLMKGASNFYIWINTLNPTTRKCVGKVIVNLIESSNNYFIQDPLFNPAIKEYIDAKQAEQDETIAGLGQLKPSGVATSSQILAFTEDKGIYISNTNGHWYYWDATLSTPSYKDSGMMYSSEIDNAKIDNVWEVETIQLVNSNEPETFKINDTSVVDLLTSKKLYIIELGIAYDTTINQLVTTSEKTIFYLESFDDELVYKSIPKFENGAVVSYQLNLYYQDNEYVLDFTYTTDGLEKAYSPARDYVYEVVELTPSSLILQGDSTYKLSSDIASKILDDKVLLCANVRKTNNSLTFETNPKYFNLLRKTSNKIDFYCCDTNYATIYYYRLSFSYSGSSVYVTFNSTGDIYATDTYDFRDKADVNDVYFKSEINTFLNAKADASTTTSGINASGHSIVLSINNTTYVLTAQLLDANNNVLNTQTIDLPLETMVVNGSYNDTTKKVVLTLQNGNTIKFSVADLISGLAKSNDSTQSIVAGDITVSKLTIGTRSGTVGSGSVAIGTSNVASGNNTLAQGSAVNAVGDGSVAMGLGAEAYGMIAHSFGYGTIAHSFQQVFGVSNIEDSYSDYENAGTDDALIEIVGGGFATNSRDNLRVTTLAGNQYIKGDLIYDTTFTSTTVTHNGVVYKKTNKTGTSLKQKITNIEQAIANMPSGGTDVGLSVVNGQICITYEEQEEEEI